MINPRPLVTFLLCLLGIYLMWNIPTLAPPVRARNKAWPRISVIVPARNEEQRIRPLLDSLVQQTRPPHEIIVIDDHSSDDTAGIAKRMGATVIHGHALPVGWTGKSWACWQGAQHASGELLLFLDADAWLETDGIERIVHSHENKGGLVTVQPYHVTRRPYEELSAFFNVVLMAGMNTFTPHGDSLEPSGSFGPCVVCSRDDYFGVGGHQRVKEDVLESIPMARLFLSHTLPVSCYGGRGAISFRMYPGGIAQLVEGWSKGVISGALSIKRSVLLAIVAWITGCFASIVDLVQSLALPLTPAALLPVMVYCLYALQIRWMLARIGSFRRWTAVLFPIPLFFFAFIMLRSLVVVRLLGRVTWRGRDIAAHCDEQ